MNRTQRYHCGGNIMTAIPFEAQPLISRYQLGNTTAIYKPHTFLSIIAGLIFMTIAAGLTLFFATITNSPLLPANLALPPLPVGERAQLPEPFGTILALGLPLIGLIFVFVGLWTIIRAIRNRHIRAIVCINGVVSVMRERTDAFRWEQVATVFHKVTRHTTTTNQYGSSGQYVGSTTTTSTSHAYTINCLDGRRFVFDSTLGRVTRLGDTIEREVARRRGGRA
jgi:Family of unknown function (DUF6585)